MNMDLDAATKRAPLPWIQAGRIVKPGRNSRGQVTVETASEEQKMVMILGQIQCNNTRRYCSDAGIEKIADFSNDTLAMSDQGYDGVLDSCQPDVSSTAQVLIREAKEVADI